MFDETCFVEIDLINAVGNQRVRNSKLSNYSQKSGFYMLLKFLSVSTFMVT